MTRREFAEQFQAIHRRLWIIAAGSIGDRTEADDIVQEAAVIAFRKIDQFQTGTNFAAWLTQIVKHCAANYRRKVGGRRTFAVDPGSLDQVQAKRPSQPRNADESTLDHLDLDDEMMASLMKLPVVARCCLLLRVIDDTPYDEIADLLNVPAGTAMSHVYRSKKEMRERLTKRVTRDKQ